VKWPVIFGWSSLAFGDKLKLVALLFQGGAGIAMTIFGFYAEWHLARLNAVWPLFYMGAIALIIIGMVVTGFGALLYKRSVEFTAFGASFKANDQESASAMATAVQTMKETENVQRADK
jgi:hypothetical protein